MALITTNAAPSPEALAAVNGVLQMSIILPQAFTPAFTTSVFALSVDKQILGGNFAWIVFFAISTFTMSRCSSLCPSTHGCDIG